MKLSFEGTLKYVEKGRPYIDRETGIESPPKFVHHFLDENQEGFQVRSKTDFSKLVGHDCFGTIEPYPQEKGSGFWLSLTDLKPTQGTID